MNGTPYLGVTFLEFILLFFLTEFGVMGEIVQAVEDMDWL